MAVLYAQCQYFIDGRTQKRCLLSTFKNSIELETIRQYVNRIASLIVRKGVSKFAQDISLNVPKATADVPSSIPRSVRYTVKKKVSGFSVPSRDVTYQNLHGRAII